MWQANPLSTSLIYYPPNNVIILQYEMTTEPVESAIIGIFSDLNPFQMVSECHKKIFFMPIALS